MATSYTPHYLNAKIDFISKSSTCLSKQRYRPRSVAMARNQSYWATIEADIKTYLENAIPIRSPESVFKPMHHLTFASPRTPASALCVASCELVGGDRNLRMGAASAVHLMHAATHIHEHLLLTEMATSYTPHYLNAKIDFISKPSTCLSKQRYRPRSVAMARNQSYWATIEADIKTYLENAIPIRSPESVFKPMHHLTFASPRTPASALCVASCELVGGDRNLRMGAASAVHLMHAATHIHEHLLLTDRPSIQHKYSRSIELMTGDGIILFGLELVARSMDLVQNNQDRILRVIAEISRASGPQGVVEGRYQELRRDHDIEAVCKKKEGLMLACGAACGATLGGGTEEEIERLRNFGVYAGTSRGLRSMLAKNNVGDDIILLGDKIEKFKGLALKELESFNGNNIAVLIASLVH